MMGAIDFVKAQIKVVIAHHAHNYDPGLTLSWVTYATPDITCIALGLKIYVTIGRSGKDEEPGTCSCKAVVAACSTRRSPAVPP